MSLRRLRSASACSATISLAIVTCACETSRQPPAIESTSSSHQTFEFGEGSTNWPFWPASMRIHPLTRIMESDDGLIIEARIEFSDGYGSTTRCMGQLRLMLVETLGDGEGELLEEWNKDLRNLNANVLHFDDITRTYLFRLEVNPDTFSRTAELRSQFLSADNARLSASHRLR